MMDSNLTLWVAVAFSSFSLLFLIFVFCFILSLRFKRFIQSAHQIEKGMSKQQVLSIMSEFSFATTLFEDTTILAWEQLQWKGILLHGGTLNRSIYVFLKNDRVISIFTRNLDKSIFW